MNLYPLKFKPIFKERIWGGQKLKDFFDKEIPNDTPIGESWELADLPKDKSTITNGPLAGKTIDEVINQFGEKITGTSDYRPPFPLLIKILDAQDDLSVQVHPDLETCRRTGKGDPKTECWYIIDKAPGAVIYKGLKPGTTKAEFEKAIKNGTCADLLQKIDVNIGECHYLPSGTAHAIGKGLLIAEIQQPSDTTYRVFDWNRIDKNTGKGRQLHVEDALESIHFDSSKDNLTVNSSGRLVDSKEFIVDKDLKEPGDPFTLPEGKMRALIIIAGSGILTTPTAEDIPFHKGDTLLIPASCQTHFHFDEKTVFLTAYV